MILTVILSVIAGLAVGVLIGFMYQKNVASKKYKGALSESEKMISEAVKKAEATGNDKIKDICQRRIIEDKSWQSAAWWLERTDPANFGQRNNLNISAEKPLIVVADEETKKLLEKLDDNASF